MSVPVRYTCPRCGAVVTLRRAGYLDDRCVTEEPLDGWVYAPPHGSFEERDGVEIVCGASETDGEGCGRPFYLSFVRHEDGEAVDPAVPLDPDEGPNFDFLDFRR